MACACISGSPAEPFEVAVEQLFRSRRWGQSSTSTRATARGAYPRAVGSLAQAVTSSVVRPSPERLSLYGATAGRLYRRATRSPERLA